MDCNLKFCLPVWLLSILSLVCLYNVFKMVVCLFLKKNMKLFCTWDKIWKYYLNNNNHLIYLLKYWYLLIFPWSYLGFYSLIPCFSNIRIFEKYSVSVNFWSFLWFLVDFFFLKKSWTSKFHISTVRQSNELFEMAGFRFHLVLQATRKKF